MLIMSACPNITFDAPPFPKVYSGLLIRVNHIVVFLRFGFENLLSKYRPPFPEVYSGLLIDINHIIIFVRFGLENRLSEYTFSSLSFLSAISSPILFY